MNVPDKNNRWIFHGQGMTSFGIHDGPTEIAMPHPGPREVLARVDAFAICASDVKMISMGNDYPLFKGRDFSAEPAILGHELSLTVINPGCEMVDSWPVGTRFGVQPDVYLNNERFCIGVNVAGGMAEYLLLGEEVFNSDYGSCAFRVDDRLSYAAVAQTEPLACVEAAFVQHSRAQMKPQGRLLIWLEDGLNRDFALDVPLVTDDVTVVGMQNIYQRFVSGVKLPQAVFTAQLPDVLFDDIIILGNPDDATLTALTERMAINGLLCWLPQSEPRKYVAMDVAKVHYNKVNLLGSSLRRLSDAFREEKYRYDYHPGGVLIISGGGGTMGRIHLQRALKSPCAPAKIIVTGNTRTRLDQMAQDFSAIIAINDIEVNFLALQDCGNFRERLRELVGEFGATDIIVSAPGVEPINAVVECLATNGTLILFSGTRYGQFGQLPLGWIASRHVTITASSGSSVADQLEVLEKMNRNEAMPDFNVAAIGGFMATKAGLQAVKEGRFPGKIVIYPQLKNLPLLPLNELSRWDTQLGALVVKNGWGRAAELMLERIYLSKT
ncbi:alcohol dehydrogenase catalytic domain-containing protein [Raoultella terrigena]|uniref:alcohol dehydrogenase catalytic domain-containing protein n=1 Tax=Raoultella terrigena TaxID=577 RepID=UPI00384F68DD